MHVYKLQYLHKILHHIVKILYHMRNKQFTILLGNPAQYRKVIFEYSYRYCQVLIAGILSTLRE